MDPLHLDFIKVRKFKSIPYIMLMKSAAPPYLPFWNEVYKHVENKGSRIQCSLNVPPDAVPCFFYFSHFCSFCLINCKPHVPTLESMSYNEAGLQQCPKPYLAVVMKVVTRL